MEDKIQLSDHDSTLLTALSNQAPAAKSQELDHRYNADYFKGRNSSYDPTGYTEDTVDWPGWLEIISQYKPGGRLCDLGCAHGFLVEHARQAGFQAVGTDISSYALGQKSELSQFLVQSDLSQLPFKSKRFDVVAVFDVLEHVAAGDRALAEAVRILKPDGLLIGTTPDPVFFNRKEPTHCFERPPSFWLELLRGWGFEVAFRFSGFDYNFQFLAHRQPQSLTIPLNHFQYDFFGSETEFVKTDELTAAPRTGWGPLRDQARTLDQSPGLVYLLKERPEPKRLRIRFRARNPQRGFGTLRVSLDGFLLDEIFLNSEEPEQEFEISDVPLCRGGHNLSFVLSPQGLEIEIAKIEIESRPLENQDFLDSLPFDLFQRYALAAEIIKRLAPGTLLDVGGLLGDADGHMATTSDFISTVDRIVTTDLRQVDLPEHQKADGLALPFRDEEFDTILSLDVLEHLPSAQREDFLLELQRVARDWILLGFPVRTPEVEEAEHRLATTVLKGHGFLSEHSQFGLPHKDLIEDFARKQDLALVSFPSGYLPHWLCMQGWTQLFFQAGTSSELRPLNRLYNRRFLEADWRTPCYRRLFLLGKTPLPQPVRQFYDQLLSSPPPDPPSLAQNLLGEATFLHLQNRILKRAQLQQQALSATQFLAGERQQEIQLLRNEIDHLKKDLLKKPPWKLWKQRHWEP